MGLNIGYLRQDNGKTARAFRVKLHYKLPDIIKLREGMDISQAAAKLGVSVEALPHLGIHESGITLIDLREALKQALPQGICLRKFEDRNFANMISAVVGRLGDEKYLLEPALEVIRTLQSVDLDQDFKSKVFADYLERHFNPSVDVRAAVSAYIPLLAKDGYSICWGAAEFLYPGDGLFRAQFMKQIEREASVIFSDMDPGIGHFPFEEGARKIAERLGWVESYPKLIAVYGNGSAGKTYLMKMLCGILGEKGLSCRPSEGAPNPSKLRLLAEWILSGRITDVLFFHCAWDKMLASEEDPNFLFNALLNREVDLNVGIYNPRHESIKAATKEGILPGRNGLYDIIISNPGSHWVQGLKPYS